MRSVRTQLPVIAVSLIGIVVCAWFVLSLRQSVTVDRATALVQSSHNLSARDLTRTRNDLRVAGQLNPDRTVTLLRAQLAARQGDRRQAERLLKQVVAAEPDNAVAWHNLATVATDAKTVRLSLHEVNQLDPNKF